MEALIQFIDIAAKVLTVLVFIRVVLSWVSPGGVNNPLIVLVYRITEPMLSPVRSLLPSMGGIDFSPVIVLFGIQIVEQLLVRLLLGMANTG
jgi:YggT family protein